MAVTNLAAAKYLKWNLCLTHKSPYPWAFIGSYLFLSSLVFPPGQQSCRDFSVPPPGEYRLLVTNSTAILHDAVKVTVLDSKIITLVQTDKPMYKPGQKGLVLWQFKKKNLNITSVRFKDCRLTSFKESQSFYYNFINRI